MRPLKAAPALSRAILVLTLLALSLPAAFAADPKDIAFGGITWGLRQTAGPTDPGPNTFSNSRDQVWVDEAGRLHLRVRKLGDEWLASELMAKKDSGYGRYRFELEGSARDLDPNIVFGFFTWDKSPASFNRELDIELSRWGKAMGEMGWFTVQPYDREGNQRSFELPPATAYSFEMNWEPDSVSFSCDADGKPLVSWRYAGAVPDPGRARLRINLWLFKGLPPSAPGPFEVVLSRFSYEPLR
jgi:hypothetical protein